MISTQDPGDPAGGWQVFFLRLFATLEIVAAANRHASAHIGLSSSPLEFRITSCRTSYINVLTPLLRGGPLPLDPPSPLVPPPYPPPSLRRAACPGVFHPHDASYSLAINNYHY